MNLKFNPCFKHHLFFMIYNVMISIVGIIDKQINLSSNVLDEGFEIQMTTVLFIFVICGIKISVKRLLNIL